VRPFAAASSASRACHRCRYHVVLGANKGIGKAIAAALASTPGFHVIGTTRTAANGTAALAELLAEGVPESSIEYADLNIDSTESVHAFTAWLTAEHGTVDVLVNNAGVDFGQYYPEGDPKNEGKKTSSNLCQADCAVVVMFGPCLTDCF
jgi:NAD(P)-dependent dehydrogenase (short-subunit alcohol dehydrogenase family)